MKLFHVSQNENNDYDTYDSFVCVATDAEEAKDISPSDGKPMNWENKDDVWLFSSWASKRKNVKVEYLGEAAPSFTKAEIVCASFNAG